MIDLTPRQRQVLHLTAEGYGVKETAEALHISPHTVKCHRDSILRDFGCHNMTHAVAVWVRAEEGQPDGG